MAIDSNKAYKGKKHDDKLQSYYTRFAVAPSWSPRRRRTREEGRDAVSLIVIRSVFADGDPVAELLCRRCTVGFPGRGARAGERERERVRRKRNITSPYTNRGGRRNSPEEKETRRRASSRQKRRYRRRKTRWSFQTHRQHYLVTVLNFICLCLCIRFEMTAWWCGHCGCRETHSRFGLFGPLRPCWNSFFPERQSWLILGCDNFFAHVLYQIMHCHTEIIQIDLYERFFKKHSNMIFHATPIMSLRNKYLTM
ncbi:uncharacterized protein LOC110272158 [Arachis ipaensis]|uniref:uncharacterized protein LOC110272158 n=1 Tax=Arachis ipaensis TaxID=130454 RepID=UPI000A2B1B75|nr:uncharacterized protein LOC110272158 [Arachis ipaensis]